MSDGESFVGVAPDGSGKAIRNVQHDVVQPDGTTKTVQMQVVVPSDLSGYSLAGEMRETNRLLSALLVEIRSINEILAQAHGVMISELKA